MFSAFSSVNLTVIPFSEIKGVQVGNAWDDKAKTGATLGKPHGMSRAIRPVFTMWDGDTIYAVSAGSDKVPAEINAVGTLAARVMEAAIVDAVRSSSVSESEYLSNI